MRRSTRCLPSGAASLQASALPPTAAVECNKYDRATPTVDGLYVGCVCWV